MSQFPTLTKPSTLFEHSHFVYSPEVRRALEDGKPVCALESTIISHGMPHPENLQTAKELEEIVRSTGTVPATIAILKGKVHIGLNEENLDFLSTSKEVEKASTRTIPILMAQGKNGATTVAATIHLAHLAGIRVMATGGIGGVHREGEKTLDISADLTELSRSQVAVVCAGAKSILDIGKTLEVLETLNVPVVGFKTKSFPAFYLPTSEFEVDYNFENVENLALFLKYKWEIGQMGGAIVANPVPKKEAMDEAVINSAIEKALKECKDKNITGKAVTPYLLKSIKEATHGSSLKTNMALVKNNARLGGELAHNLAKNFRPLPSF